MKIAHLFSGGVDSSTALKLLKDQGQDVTAFYLKIWLEEEMAFIGDCPWEEDLEYVRKTCDQLDVPLEIINMQREYYDRVVEYAISELKQGRTPSPDIMCNRSIKFGLFLDNIDFDYDMVSSGHYAQIEKNSGRYYLKQSPDPVKDQTYFLTYLDQKQLSRILFPIGKYSKEEVRKMALEFDLPTKNRKDSQGICFLGKIKYNDFVKFHLGEKKGDIIDIETGEKYAEHNGYWYYTIGQRQGIGLGGGPWYVAKKDIENNIIYITRDKTSFQVPRDKFGVNSINWIPSAPSHSDLQVKLRHGPNKYNCEVKLSNSKHATVNLEQTDDGIAPGQFSIFYDGDYCIGGGVIHFI